MPYCIQKYEGGVLVSRLCSGSSGVVSGETSHYVDSCTECPPFPSGGTIQKEELKAMLKEILAELLPHGGSGEGQGGGT
jgi:hypothetical protein